MSVQKEESMLSRQLGQIEKLQLRLHELLIAGETDYLDDILSEKRARLEAVLAERETEEFGARPVYARLLRILRADHELQALINRQLSVLGTELRKTSEAQRLTRAYLGRPAAATAGSVSAIPDLSL